MEQKEMTCPECGKRFKYDDCDSVVTCPECGKEIFLTSYGRSEEL